MATPAFSVATWRAHGVTVFSLTGELDMLTEPLARRALSQCLAGQPQSLVIDLSGLALMQAAGIRMLLEARQLLAGRGAYMCVAVTPGTVTHRLVALSNLGLRVPVFESLDEALASAPPGSGDGG